MIDMLLLESVKPGTILATGLSSTPAGIQRYVAVRGGVPDWALYTGPQSLSAEEIAKTGTKVIAEIFINSMVNCSEDALKWYRR